MNTGKQLFIIIILFFSINSFSQNEIKPPYDIKDYFLLLPDNLIGNVTIEQRRLSLQYKTLKDLWDHNAFWIIDTLDYGNGYMKLSSTGDGSGTYFEITYFIKKDKTREIAVNTTKWDLAMTSSEVKFYTFINNTWTDITKNVLPVVTISDIIGQDQIKRVNDTVKTVPIIYSLPQKGKTIIAEIDMGTVDLMLNDNIINEEEYKKIKNSAKKIKLMWKDGIFFVEE